MTIDIDRLKQLCAQADFVVDADYPVDMPFLPNDVDGLNWYYVRGKEGGTALELIGVPREELGDFVAASFEAVPGLIAEVGRLRAQVSKHGAQPAVHYQCNACGKRMKTWHEMEEYQHAECGGLVELAAVIAMRTERDTALARVAEVERKADDDRSQRRRAVVAVAICQERIAELERELAVERNSLRAQFDAVTAERACPCLYTTPCHERCTCVNQVSSIGCRRCCSYGSMEQRKAMAERLVNAERETVERIAQLADARAAELTRCPNPYRDDVNDRNDAKADELRDFAADIRSGAWKRGQDV